MSNQLRQVLGLEPEEKQIIDFQEIDDDFDFSRKNIMDLIGKSSEALEDMIDLARKSQSPEAYEILNQMFKNNVNMNKDLIELRKKSIDAKQKIVNETEGKVVNQNLFVGTTSDLNKMLEDLNEKRVNKNE